jgi:radical SAM enzyme (TIGR01210 family)
MLPSTVFPKSPAERDQWILRRRKQRNAVTADEPYACFAEEECGADGRVECVATVFLTNRECPFRCTMCDLWRNTLTESVPSGAIPQQIDIALSRLGPARSVKLYNSGSFFDPRAIPPEDYKAIAARLQGFERIILECHPAFVGESCVEFRDLLQGRLEVAMGLETAHRETLDKLNKRMTLEQFRAAASFLLSREIDLRVFILVQPPFMKTEESPRWTRHSLDFAFDCGATAAALIPTRGGNGAMEALAEAGMFAAPGLKMLEDAAEYGLGLMRGRVFADLWELNRDRECPRCFDARVQRLRQMNLRQVLVDAVDCEACSGRYQESA